VPAGSGPLDRTTIEVADVHAAFAAVIGLLRPARPVATRGVSPLAVVDPTARIATDVDIHALATIGADVEIGPGVTIHSGVRIGAGCRIGTGTVIFSNAVLYDDTRVGARCTIHATAVLGAHGFGYKEAGGGYLLSAGLMVAFASLYPNTEFFGWVPMKWLIFASLAFGSLVSISQQDYIGLIALWGTAGVAFSFIRDYQGGGPLTAVTDWWQRRRSKLRLVPRPGSETRPAKARGKSKAAIDHRAEVDRILEKISQQGISSLTGKERAFLEAASDRMKGKPKRESDSDADE
jgi:carbonic anhydrase/acetyltransferase-like protein (isoleucine patch superfamily)